LVYALYDLERLNDFSSRGCFISYSHDDEDYKRRVEELATKLKEKFHVVFDQNRGHQDENLHWSLNDAIGLEMT